MARELYTPELVITKPGSVVTDLRAYSTIADAISDIGATPTTLLISRDESIAGSQTIASTIRLQFTNGSVLTVPAGATLTINGPIVNGRQQIFSNTGGTITLGDAIDIVYPEWWGTGNDSFLYACESAADYATISLGCATYVITGSVTLGSRKCEGSGIDQTDTNASVIKASDGFTDEYMIEINGYAALRDFVVDGNNKATRLLYLHNIQNPTRLDHLWLRDTSKAAMYIYRDSGAKVQDILCTQVFCQPRNTLTESFIYMYNANECQFIGCKFYGNASADGVANQQTSSNIFEMTGTGTSSCRGNTFLGCSFTYAGGSGYYGLVVNGDQNQVIGCTFERNYGAIRVGDNSVTYTRQNVFVHNRIFLTGDAVATNGNAYYLDYCLGTRVDHLEGAGTTPGDIILTANSSDCIVHAYAIDRTITDGGTDNAIFLIEPGGVGLFPVSPTTGSSGDGSPDVNKTSFLVTANDVVTNIRDFDRGAIGEEDRDGHTLVILAGDNNTTMIHDGAKLILNGAADFAMAAGDTLTLIHYNGIWYEIARSDNT